MRVDQLLDDPTLADGAAHPVEVRGVTANSRGVEPGYLFAALKGLNVDGADFIGDAVARGAVAVLTRPGVDVAGKLDANSAVPLVVHDSNPEQRFALLAARFYARQPKTIAAVTGTNGKTPVARFPRQIWTKLGFRAASMGTLGVVGPRGVSELRYTTPGPVAVFETLRALADDEVDYLAMEASSHGLAQYRMDGVHLRAAAFTNLTQDHLDYHPTFDDYLQAKLRLFSELLPTGGTAVINADADLPVNIMAVCRGRGADVMEVGTTAPATGRHIRLNRCTPDLHGQILSVRWQDAEFDVHVPLVGSFQASNALMAAGLAIACGAAPDAVFRALASLEGVPGRLQLAGRTAKAAPIFVDYAHTPDAIANVLDALRPHTEGRLHIVLGAGGDRDRTKRPLMAAAAAARADVVSVTDDNPRTEDPADIRREVLAGAPDAQDVPGRAAAIAQAIGGLAAGDVLVIAGKGHETGQIVGDEVIPFSDIEEVRRVLGGEAA